LPEPVERLEPDDYEIVLGRRQLASVSFVAVVLMAVLSTVSYVAGKAMSPVAGKAPSAITGQAMASTVPAATPPPVARTPILEATIVPPAVPVAPISRTKGDGQAEAPLFADPLNGAVYIQIGAVEKGIAVLLAEGLRSDGLESFVAPGPNERVFRVLIGPLPNPGSFTRAKETVDLLGLATFARKYQK